MFVSWKMADTGPVPDQYVLAPHLRMNLVVQVLLLNSSYSTQHSILAPVTAEKHKEASPHWHVLHNFPLGA